MSRIGTAHWPEADRAILADAFSTTAFRLMWFVGVLLIGAYLLFAHGCHADVDTELITEPGEFAKWLNRP
jgi:hypothetical protein